MEPGVRAASRLRPHLREMRSRGLWAATAIGFSEKSPVGCGVQFEDRTVDRRITYFIVYECSMRK